MTAKDFRRIEDHSRESRELEALLARELLEPPERLVLFQVSFPHEDALRLLALAALRPAGAGPRREVLAAIGAFAVADPLRVRLPALVVRARIVVGAVAADVEIPPAVRAGIAKAHPLARAELHESIAGEAMHALTVREPPSSVKRSRARRGEGDSLRRACGSDAASGDSAQCCSSRSA